ncbi:uncharacterized protein LOC116158903 isoform X2 [Photinus pyralis]|uniref:uncharacterized protein LOC116158903 isoform X2 n=1 Tax=Photinus pyralis TaxID=7054 RepID=UPI00126761F8|nr:uncharacterized protein LOC116158903 isoform X2 [Photinus pyralis]
MVYKKLQRTKQAWLFPVPNSTDWSNSEIMVAIKELFQHMLNDIEFEILVSMNRHLIKINLPPGIVFDGKAMKRRFHQKVIYIRPFVKLSKTVHLGTTSTHNTADDETNNSDDYEDMHETNEITPFDTMPVEPSMVTV